MFTLHLVQIFKAFNLKLVFYVKLFRFRIGGESEILLNKTEVEETLSTHFVGKVFSPFLCPYLFHFFDVRSLLGVFHPEGLLEYED